MSDRSYRQIFKSTSLVGGAQIANMAIGIVRVKVLAILLGPSGVGLAGMFQSATGLIGTISGMGIRSAGVRQIADASGGGDEAKISRTVKTLRMASLVSGLLGMAVAMALSIPLSHATFGNDEYALGVAIVSLMLLFDGVSAGQTALLQGLRRLRDLAKCQIMGALLGTAASIALVWWLGKDGVAPYLATNSALMLLVCWWFARRVPIKKIVMARKDFGREARTLLGIGVAFMGAAVMTAGGLYLNRILIIRHLGMDVVGLYTATVTLSSLYVGIVLGAMAADFYPRLTARANDHAAVNRMVNEQTEMGLLMALPGILATLVLAPWILRLFYTEAFVSATGVLRWQILGVALRVISWPMGFIQMAKGRSGVFVAVEFAFHSLHLAFVYACLKIWGLEGLGIAFCLAYVLHVLGTMAVARWLTGFTWSMHALFLILPSCGAMFLTFLTLRVLPELWGLIVGLLLVVASCVVSILLLQKILDINAWTVLRSKLRRKGR